MPNQQVNSYCNQCCRGGMQYTWFKRGRKPIFGNIRLLPQVTVIKRGVTRPTTPTFTQQMRGYKQVPRFPMRLGGPAHMLRPSGSVFGCRTSTKAPLAPRVWKRSRASNFELLSKSKQRMRGSKILRVPLVGCWDYKRTTKRNTLSFVWGSSLASQPTICPRS